MHSKPFSHNACLFSVRKIKMIFMLWAQNGVRDHRRGAHAYLGIIQRDSGAGVSELKPKQFLLWFDELSQTQSSTLSSVDRSRSRGTVYQHGPRKLVQTPASLISYRWLVHCWPCFNWPAGMFHSEVNIPTCWFSGTASEGSPLTGLSNWLGAVQLYT